MNARITARHFSISDDLRNFVQDRIDKLQQYYDGITAAHVILDLANGRAVDQYSAEIVITVYRQTLSAKESADSHELAIDGCTDGLRRQLLRYKAKLKDTAKDYHR